MDLPNQNIAIEAIVLKGVRPMVLPKKYEAIDEWKTLMFLYDSALREISKKRVGLE